MQKLTNKEPRPKLTGSYKKSVYIVINVVHFYITRPRIFESVFNYKQKAETEKFSRDSCFISCVLN